MRGLKSFMTFLMPLESVQVVFDSRVGTFQVRSSLPTSTSHKRQVPSCIMVARSRPSAEKTLWKTSPLRLARVTATSPPVAASQRRNDQLSHETTGEELTSSRLTVAISLPPLRKASDR